MLKHKKSHSVDLFTMTLSEYSNSEDKTQVAPPFVLNTSVRPLS